MSRYTPEKFWCRPPPPCAGRCRTESWVWKSVALHGGVAATVAGVALHCATKGQIRRGRIWRFWGAPIFSPEVPKHLFWKGLGTSGRKIGAPQKRQIQPRQIWPPICGPLIYRCVLNCDPINSKKNLWGNFKITPLKISFDEIFWCHFLPQRLPAVASLHSMLQNYPA